ncbi:MAG: ABC transporter permease, partial [Betaproteobacteria bacterium]
MDKTTAELQGTNLGFLPTLTARLLQPATRQKLLAFASLLALMIFFGVA